MQTSKKLLIWIIALVASVSVMRNIQVDNSFDRLSNANNFLEYVLISLDVFGYAVDLIITTTGGSETVKTILGGKEMKPSDSRETPQKKLQNSRKTRSRKTRKKKTRASRPRRRR